MRLQAQIANIWISWLKEFSTKNNRIHLHNQISIHFYFLIFTPKWIFNNNNNYIFPPPSALNSCSTCFITHYMYAKLLRVPVSQFIMNSVNVTPKYTVKSGIIVRKTNFSLSAHIQYLRFMPAQPNESSTYFHNH